MILAMLTLISGLAISSVAIYYSVIGLAAIFAASAMPIMIMGTILEISKLVAAWWLKWNWKRAPVFLKTYMLGAVLVLMFITSMGIFGYLSKAHIEQGVPTGDIISKVEIIDQQILTEESIIKQARADLDLLNDQLTKYTEMGYVTKGVNVRKSQTEERKYITSEIKKSQETISQLRRERAPLSSSVRQSEADVGPIKYIAQLIYGDNTNATILEKAVVWVIMIIVFVFDPLAILLLLSAQLSFQWAKERKIESQKGEQNDKIEEIIPQVSIVEDQPKQHANEETIAEEPSESEFEDVVEDVDVLGNEPNTDDPTESPKETQSIEKELLTKAENEPIITTNNDDDEITWLPMPEDDLLPEEVFVPFQTIPQDVMDKQWEEFDEMFAAENEPTHHTPETHPYLRSGNNNDYLGNVAPMVHHRKPTLNEAMAQVFDNLADMPEEELLQEIENAIDSGYGAALADALVPQPIDEKQADIQEPIEEVIENLDSAVNDIVITQIENDIIEQENTPPNPTNLFIAEPEVINIQLDPYNEKPVLGEPKKNPPVEWMERVDGQQVKRTSN